MSQAAVDAATELLYQNIHALPDPEFGHINMLPFAHDSEQVRQLKRQFCAAITRLLNSNSLLASGVAEPPEPLTRHTATVKCGSCANPIAEIATDDRGLAMVNAHMFIGGVAKLNPQCPHAPLSPDDIRRDIEQRFYAQEEL